MKFNWRYVGIGHIFRTVQIFRLQKIKMNCKRSLQATIFLSEVLQANQCEHSGTYPQTATIKTVS